MATLKNIIKELIYIVIIIISIIFLFNLLLNQQYNYNGFKLTENIVQNVVKTIKNYFHGNFGYDYYQRPALPMLIGGLLLSLKVIIPSIIVSITFGTILGILLSNKNGINTIKALFINTIFSIPDVMYAIIVQFAAVYLVKAHIFSRYPVSGNYSLLPTITLSIILIVYLSKIACISLNSVYKEDFITALEGRGYTKFRIIRHAFWNILPDILSSSTSYLVLMITSLTVIECIFLYNGIFMISLRKMDVDGTTIGFILIFLVMHLFTLLSNLLKRRIEIGGTSVEKD